jgi:arsenite-transporting ATPase
MRIILYTGKGGVGKTSVAAATALLAAERGYRTVIMSTDPAHSLADSFDTPLSGQPTPIAPNLWGQEIDVLKELEFYWRKVQEWLTALLRWQGLDEIVAEEMAVLPGMEELVALLYITRYNRQGDYDLLVVDCAPTGETLRLLSFPDMARWYMHRLFPLQRGVTTAIRPIAKGVLRIPVPGQEVFDSIQELYLELEEMRSLLLDARISSIRLVVNPEKMVIKEAQRTFTYLNLYGYHTDLVVCNRILPQEVGDSFFDSWKESQERYLELIRQSFDPLPILKAPLLDREVVGLDSLRELGNHIFNGQDPARVFYLGQTQEVRKEGKRHILMVRLPFASKEELTVMEDRDELVVQVGRYRRNIILPRVLIGLSVEEAKLEGDILKVTFKEDRRRRS